MKSQIKAAPVGRVLARPPTSKNGDGKTAAILPALRTWLGEKDEPMSIEVLLTRVMDALAMGIDVGVDTDQIDPKRAAAMSNKLASLKFKYAQELKVINEICRAGLNLRKRGLLRIEGASSAMPPRTIAAVKANETRRMAAGRMR